MGNQRLEVSLKYRTAEGSLGVLELKGQSFYVEVCLTRLQRYRAVISKLYRVYKVFIEVEKPIEYGNFGGNAEIVFRPIVGWKTFLV
ncbi:hypothetical protein A7W90_06100 [Clostridium sp. Bc-iso-3]|nr:hypothetical protein A7W90_06100 [Clostridium sp. Bc-iso-3]